MGLHSRRRLCMFLLLCYEYVFFCLIVVGDVGSNLLLSSFFFANSMIRFFLDFYDELGHRDDQSSIKKIQWTNGKKIVYVVEACTT